MKGWEVREQSKGTLYGHLQVHRCHLVVTGVIELKASG